MACAIPGYDSVAEFSRIHNLGYKTVLSHLKRGYCAYPRVVKDGSGKHPLYGTWRGMIQRCLNPNATNYADYGGTGVKVCPQWIGNFKQFLADLGDKPGESFTLDRIDVDGDYEPSNCRWATPIEQAHNKRKPLGCVHFAKLSNRWRVKWRDKVVKTFKEKEKADNFLDLKRREHYGNDYKQKFPQQQEDNNDNHFTTLAG